MRQLQLTFHIGIAFMRGGAVGILCILKDATDGNEYALTTLQPRVPAASDEFCEIPAGMVLSIIVLRNLLTLFDVVR